MPDNTETTPAGGNVFADLGLPRADERLRLAERARQMPSPSDGWRWCLNPACPGYANATTDTPHAHEVRAPAPSVPPSGETERVQGVLDAADGLCFAAFSLLEMKGPLDADDYRDLLRSAWERYCDARETHDIVAMQERSTPHAEPSR